MPRKKTNLTMPVLALRGLMVFPHMVLHFDVGRPKSVAALQEAMMNDQKIFLVAQKDVDDPDPTPENLCTVGTIANIRQVMNLPGDSLRVLVEGETRGELTAVTQEDPFLLGRIHLPKVTAPADEMELAALVRTAKDYFDAYARASQRVSQETIASIRDVDDAEQIADLIAANILTKLEDRQQILEEFDIQRRLERLCTILSREIELTGVEKQVQERVKKQIDKNQKDYYLREHMKAIQTELGDTDATDVEELRERAKNTPLNDEARQRVDKELERLSRMTPGTPEVGMSRTYIEWILDLPWGKQTTDNLDLKRARKVLAQDITAWRKSRNASSSIWRCSSSSRICAARFCASSARPAWAKHPSFAQSPRQLGGSSCRCRSAACATRRKSAAIAGHISARFRGGLSPA